MLEIELLSILRSTCDIIGRSHEIRKVDSQIMQAADSSNCGANGALQIQTDKKDVHNGKKSWTISNLVQIEQQTKRSVKCQQIKFIICSVIFFQG